MCSHSHVKIRDAEWKDLPSMCRMINEIFCDLQGIGLEVDLGCVSDYAISVMDMKTRVVLVAEDCGNMVGGIAGYVEPWRFNMSKKVLMQIGWYLEPEYRESAIGGLLFRSFIDKGRGLGAEIINACCKLEHKRVHNFYRTLGMVPTDSFFVGRV